VRYDGFLCFPFESHIFHRVLGFRRVTMCVSWSEIGRVTLPTRSPRSGYNRKFNIRPRHPQWVRY
jgi:hypothetical protein